MNIMHPGSSKVAMNGQILQGTFLFTFQPPQEFDVAFFLLMHSNIFAVIVGEVKEIVITKHNNEAN